MILNEACSADDERLFDTDGGDVILMMLIAMTRTMVTKQEAT